VDTEHSRRQRDARGLLAPAQGQPRCGWVFRLTRSSGTLGLIARLALLSVLAQAIHAKASTGKLADALELDVGSRPVASALLEIGQRYSVIISFPPNLVEGRRSAPLHGRYTLSQALEAALCSSDLAADIAPEGIVTVKRVPPAEAAPKPAPADPAQAPDQQDSPGPLALERVVIYGKADLEFHVNENDFTASSTEIATLHNTPVSRVPQAVSVVTQDMLAASQARTQLEALSFATGVSSFDGGGGSQRAATIRGFPAPLLLSGLNSYRSALPVESAAIERIEVLKGPSGTVGGVTGENGRGGVINIVRKRPYAGQKPSATLHADSADGGTLQANADVGGGEGDTLWRLVGYGARSRERATGYDPLRTEGLLGSLSHRTRDHSATLTLQHEKRRDLLPGTTRPRFDDSNSAYGPASEEVAMVSCEDGRDSRIDDAEVDAQWRLSDRWRARAHGRWERAGLDVGSHRYFSELEEVRFERTAVKASGKSWRWSLLGSLETGPVKHTLLAAIDTQHYRQSHQYTLASWYVDAETYVPGQTPLPATPDFGTLELKDFGESFSSERGVMLQDQLRFGDATVRLAMRRSRYQGMKSNTLGERSFAGRSWDAGASYRLWPGMTVYAGAQAALEASLYAGQAVYDFAVPAGKSQQQQIGAKYDWDDALSLTLEAYRLRQRNSLFVTYGAEGDRHPQLAPGKASTGIELELSGRASAALDLSIGVNVMRARQLGFSSAEHSYWSHLQAVPERSMHVLANYRLPQSVAAGVTLGLALRAQSGSWVIAPDPDADWPGMRVPGGAQLDLSWMRRDTHWSFGMTVHNVFNRKLYTPTTDNEFLPLNRGRSVGLTLSYRG
jgi:iron complex outermembrane receptor protein